jgi:hypothetical protein
MSQSQIPPTRWPYQSPQFDPFLTLNDNILLHLENLTDVHQLHQLAGIFTQEVRSIKSVLEQNKSDEVEEENENGNENNKMSIEDCIGGIDFLEKMIFSLKKFDLDDNNRPRGVVNAIDTFLNQIGSFYAKKFFLNKKCVFLFFKHIITYFETYFSVALRGIIPLINSLKIERDVFDQVLLYPFLGDENEGGAGYEKITIDEKIDNIKTPTEHNPSLTTPLPHDLPSLQEALFRANAEWEQLPTIPIDELDIYGLVSHLDTFIPNADNYINVFKNDEQNDEQNGQNLEPLVSPSQSLPPLTSHPHFSKLTHMQDYTHNFLINHRNHHIKTTNNVEQSDTNENDQNGAPISPPTPNPQQPLIATHPLFIDIFSAFDLQPPAPQTASQFLFRLQGCITFLELFHPHYHGISPYRIHMLLDWVSLWYLLTDNPNPMALEMIILTICDAFAKIPLENDQNGLNNDNLTITSSNSIDLPHGDMGDSIETPIQRLKRRKLLIRTHFLGFFRCHIALPLCLRKSEATIGLPQMIIYLINELFNILQDIFNFDNDFDKKNEFFWLDFFLKFDFFRPNSTHQLDTRISFFSYLQVLDLHHHRTNFLKLPLFFASFSKKIQKGYLKYVIEETWDFYFVHDKKKVENFSQQIQSCIFPQKNIQNIEFTQNNSKSSKSSKSSTLFSQTSPPTFANLLSQIDPHTPSPTSLIDRYQIRHLNSPLSYLAQFQPENIPSPQDDPNSPPQTTAPQPTSHSHSHSNSNLPYDPMRNSPTRKSEHQTMARKEPTAHSEDFFLVNTIYDAIISTFFVGPHHGDLANLLNFFCIAPFYLFSGCQNETGIFSQNLQNPPHNSADSPYYIDQQTSKTHSSRTVDLIILHKFVMILNHCGFFSIQTLFPKSSFPNHTERRQLPQFVLFSFSYLFSQSQLYQYCINDLSVSIDSQPTSCRLTSRPRHGIRDFIIPDDDIEDLQIDGMDDRDDDCGGEGNVRELKNEEKNNEKNEIKNDSKNQIDQNKNKIYPGDAFTDFVIHYETPSTCVTSPFDADGSFLEHNLDLLNNITLDHYQKGHTFRQSLSTSIFTPLYQSASEHVLHPSGSDDYVGGTPMAVLEAKVAWDIFSGTFSQYKTPQDLANWCRSVLCMSLVLNSDDFTYKRDDILKISNPKQTEEQNDPKDEQKIASSVTTPSQVTSLPVSSNLPTESPIQHVNPRFAMRAARFVPRKLALMSKNEGYGIYISNIGKFNPILNGYGVGESGEGFDKNNDWEKNEEMNDDIADDKRYLKLISLPCLIGPIFEEIERESTNIPVMYNYDSDYHRLHHIHSLFFDTKFNQNQKTNITPHNSNSHPILTSFLTHLPEKMRGQTIGRRRFFNARGTELLNDIPQQENGLKLIPITTPTLKMLYDHTIAVQFLYFRVNLITILFSILIQEDQ